MADLEQLMNVKGAVAAFRFDDKGELLEHRIEGSSELDGRILDLLCHVCVANMAMATMQARGWETTTEMKGFYPIQGFSLIGYEWTAVVGDGYGLIVPNEQADFQGAFQALGQ